MSQIPLAGRLAPLALAALLSACAPTAPTSTPADWAALADALGSDEYAEVFLDELDGRLDDADAELSDRQHDAVYQLLYDGAEAQRAVVTRYRDAGPAQAGDAARALRELNAQTDAAVEAVLTPAQAPVYRALQAEARARLASEAGGV